MSTAACGWDVWSTRARLVVTDPAGDDAAHTALAAARTVAETHLADVDAACSRFRDCSELRAVEHAQGQPVEVTTLLAELVAVALTAAENTDGDVDPTVGQVMDAIGYDRDVTLGLGGQQVPVSVQVPGWRRVHLRDGVLTVPRGAHLDLGATAKAAAADRAAALVHSQLGCGVLLSLGGDIATAGPAPAGGWQVRVEDTPGDPACQVALAPGGAIATSSTVKRRWTRGGRTVHHVVDPRTGLPATTRWRTVTVAAATCVEANTVTTACIVRGDAAIGWLRELGLPARLVDDSRRVHTLNGWPVEPEPATDRTAA